MNFVSVYSHSKNLEQICRPVSVCASRKQITVALLERVLRSLWIYDLLVLKRNICLVYMEVDLALPYIALVGRATLCSFVFLF